MVATYVFGNGNLSFGEFVRLYVPQLERQLALPDAQFLIGDFRGVDTLTLEWLKTATPRVRVFHVGTRPRYLPDAFRTQVGSWELVGGFASDSARDQAAIAACSHYLAYDINSDDSRQSGTYRNILACRALGKLRLGEP